MGLDDLLGLLFLFFFIVLPALQGLLRRGQQVPPDFEPDEILLPGEERRPASSAPPTRSSTPTPSSPPPSPPARPVVSQPAPSPKPKTPPRRPRSLEEVERERQSRPSPRPSSEPPQKASSKPQPKSKKTTDQWAFSTSTRAILNGVVWHQILAEPRSQYWRRVRKAKR
ncbi:hypothetical protein [Meiothermus ruber]|jgi:hypothetical protein|uniref:Uncharacterized protein n=1 Tax=Meiothermus ruber (strain ATCC 35948 / DSM 1279 / VKM B-1258 / 21) TaxID=504728 RepID=D3PSZ1_MEIRD|nr:hypothetical protein [Meiothermus ruber]ADD28574.1 hypothetical protein Mrub_1816 [Meiothermus ruber DSM 1279]AGK05980.1 hypothetical protein K649_13470 [Meiothermus ruber DSM 1279]MCL6531083.1 hypothetical protein [Meiothermus ruber]GAO75543.1 putative uncharacterized protein [Meiothermus ruber H328]